VVPFLCNLYESEKSDKSILSYILMYLRARERIKTKLGKYSHVFYEHEKEQRLSSDCFHFYASFKKKKMFGPGFIFTQV
jgi:hypothetical protein